MKARVLAIRTDSDDAKRLAEMGLVPGTEFEVIKIAPLGDPVEISLRGYRLCLRKREADFLEIEPIQ
ncbi:MAG: FeoA domain-containing protein [Fimbriimonadales bacterium]